MTTNDLRTWEDYLSRQPTSSLIILMNSAAHISRVLRLLELQLGLESSLAAVWAEIDARIPPRAQ